MTWWGWALVILAGNLGVIIGGMLGSGKREDLVMEILWLREKIRKLEEWP